MKGQASVATSTNFRCPVCGATQFGKICTALNGSFACPRCRTVLEVTTPRSSQSLTLLVASIVIALSLSIAMGLQAPRFAMVVGAAAAFNWLGQTMRNLVALPELRVRSNTHDKGLPQNVLSARRADTTPRATRRHESLQCPLVVTHN